MEWIKLGRQSMGNVFPLKEDIMYCEGGDVIADYDIGRGGGGVFCELEDGRYGIAFSLPDPDEEVEVAVLGDEMEEEARNLWGQEVGKLIMEHMEMADGHLKITDRAGGLMAELSS